MLLFLALRVSNSLKHTAIDAAAPLEIGIQLDFHSRFQCLAGSKLTLATRAASASPSVIYSWWLLSWFTMASVQGITCKSSQVRSASVRTLNLKRKKHYLSHIQRLSYFLARLLQTPGPMSPWSSRRFLQVGYRTAGPTRPRPGPTHQEPTKFSAQHQIRGFSGRWFFCPPQIPMCKSRGAHSD